MTSLTGATATIYLSITGLFPTPVKIEGFAADDVFSMDDMQVVETLRGVDGKLSGGYVYADIRQRFSIQADSPSAALFDTWFNAMQVARDTFTATGTTNLTALGTNWTMQKGFLRNFKPIPDVKKLIQPRQFTIEWEAIFPSPVQ